ncbi:hypothetical protein N7478_011310 [Penicillium angulare]|uniref:uncharacterized protein n=1 Tax=Penicillium angulare TaxID=116970 RepID=UPI002540AA75|nr:uncharacterized protein N7478_011310 [Penicillium angulare]KAJ5263705.1 hypothetical protein N7478_011310 [Penicillium angulare]
MAENSDIFERLRDYPFNTDQEFANGLAIILGHPATPATEEEINRDDDLVLQAKCFFFSRNENLTSPIEFAAYKSWLASSTPSESQQPTQATDESDTSGNEKAATTEPAYPSSFAHIVDLITTGQPIPGIEQIPDTVLTGHEISSEKPRRRKPWEKDGAEQSHNEPEVQAS